MPTSNQGHSRGSWINKEKGGVFTLRGWREGVVWLMCWLHTAAALRSHESSYLIQHCCHSVRALFWSQQTKVSFQYCEGASRAAISGGSRRNPYLVHDRCPVCEVPRLCCTLSPWLPCRSSPACIFSSSTRAGVIAFGSTRSVKTLPKFKSLNHHICKNLT